LRIIAAVVLSIGALISPRAAKADWQFTNWGMSVHEVEKSSGGRTVRVHNAKGNPTDRLMMQWPSGDFGFEFEVFFGFVDDSLDTVRLELVRGSAAEFAKVLETDYGEPNSRNDLASISKISLWRTSEDLIFFVTTRTDEYAMLVYKCSTPCDWHKGLLPDRRGLTLRETPER
jgi:hypothetical protein